MKRRKYIRLRKRDRFLFLSKFARALTFLTTIVAGCIIEDVWHLLAGMLWGWLKILLW
jgi:hypothetical protein